MTTKSARIAELEKKVDELEWEVITANNLYEAKCAEAKKSHSNNAALRKEIEELKKRCIELEVCYDKDIHYEHSRFKELETECYQLKEKIYVVDGETGMLTDELIADKWKKWTTTNFMKWRTRLHAERCAFECVDDDSDLDLGKYIKYLEDMYNVEEHTLLTDSEDENDSEDSELEFNNFDNVGVWCGGSGNSMYS